MSRAECPATKSLIHVLCISCVLGVFWPMAARLTEPERLGGGVQIRRCKMAGRGWTQLQIEADGCVREFQIQTWFAFTTAPRGQRGSTASSRSGSSYCARRKWASHPFITETHWKSSWEKKNQIAAAHRERSPSEVQQYISVGFTHSDKAPGLQALPFLPLAYFIWLNHNGFWRIQSFCFHAIFVLIVMHDDR